MVSEAKSSILAATGRSLTEARVRNRFEHPGNEAEGNHIAVVFGCALRHEEYAPKHDLSTDQRLVEYKIQDSSELTLMARYFERGNLLVGVSGGRRCSTSFGPLDSRQHQVPRKSPDEPTTVSHISTVLVTPVVSIVSHVEDASQVGVLGSAEVEVFLDTEQLAGR